MPHFVCKLIPPRPSFASEMSEQEAAAMAEHAAYWARLLEAGPVVIYGPVADPEGVYGLAIVEAADPAEVERLTADDPVIKAGLGLRYHCAPMLQAVVGRTGPGPLQGG